MSASYAPSGYTADYGGSTYAGRYTGMPSAAMRARFANARPEVLAFCCVLGDILYDIYTANERTTVERSVTPCQPSEQPKRRKAANSRASSRTRAASPALAQTAQPRRKR